jgi:hypothetical protein
MDEGDSIIISLELHKEDGGHVEVTRTAGGYRLDVTCNDYMEVLGADAGVELTENEASAIAKALAGKRY